MICYFTTSWIILYAFMKFLPTIRLVWSRLQCRSSKRHVAREYDLLLRTRTDVKRCMRFMKSLPTNPVYCWHGKIMEQCSMKCVPDIIVPNLVLLPTVQYRTTVVLRYYLDDGGDCINQSWSGCSTYCRNCPWKRAKVAPSTNRWSAHHETVMIWAA